MLLLESTTHHLVEVIARIDALVSRMEIIQDLRSHLLACWEDANCDVAGSIVDNVAAELQGNSKADDDDGEPDKARPTAT
jgi:hypothetical protein